MRTSMKPAEQGESEFILTAEIPSLFHKGPRWLERNLKKLKEEGFPEPVSRGVYLREAVVKFRDNRGRARLEPEVRALPTSAKDVRALIDRTLSRGRSHAAR